METAEDLVIDKYWDVLNAVRGSMYTDPAELYKCMIEFAKMHCEALVKEISDYTIDCGEEAMADEILNIHSQFNIK